MNELSEVYAALGRRTAQFDKVVDEYGRFLAIVRAIKMGEIPLDRLNFNPNGTWDLLAEEKLEANKAAEKPAKGKKGPKLTLPPEPKTEPKPESQEAA